MADSPFSRPTTPPPLYKDLATWTPWLEFEVFPVLDILEASPITNEALTIAKTVV